LMTQFGTKLFSNHKEQKTLSFVPSERKCVRCSEVKLLNIDNYKKVKHFKQGYSYYCNNCDEEMRKTGK
jgi:hypothetical protein